MISWIVARGLSERAAKAAAIATCLIAVLLILASLRGAWAIFDWFNDRDAVEKAVNKANVDALDTAREADDQAARTAQADEQVISDQAQEAIDAIENAQGGAPSAAAVAHNCQRLRAYGFEGTDLPGACRSGEAAGR